MHADETSPWIIEADDATFQERVVERSRELPIVIDFWATWCQPCRMLGPILENLARDFDGKFLLAKVDTEKAPNIAAAFNVQSIPAVYGLREGQLLDFFVGLLPEPQIRSWLERLLPSPAEQLVVEGKSLAAQDPAAAEAKFRDAASLDGNLAEARIALLELLLDQLRTEDAANVLDELEKRGYLEPAAEKLKARLHLTAQADKPHDLEALRQAVLTSPGDLQAKLDLAGALATERQFSDALETALAVVSSGKKDFVEPARAFMVDLFRLLEDQPELVTEFRRRLSTALY